MESKTFQQMFKDATKGNQPFPYQITFAGAAQLPELLNVPTGAGKTATAILGWLWRRCFTGDLAVRAACRAAWFIACPCACSWNKPAKKRRPGSSTWDSKKKSMSIFSWAARTPRLGSGTRTRGHSHRHTGHASIPRSQPRLRHEPLPLANALRSPK